MRSFTFDVVDLMNADGYCRVVEGAKWIKLANKMVSEGRATLVENKRGFAGYGSSRDISYWRFNMTVTEKVN